jgi:hypothetical protein
MYDVAGLPHTAPTYGKQAIVRAILAAPETVAVLLGDPLSGCHAGFILWPRHAMSAVGGTTCQLNTCSAASR